MRTGSELEAARKKGGISVDVLSKRTKIRVSTLVALETNDFKNLPKGFYLFSAVRAYAREVHINPEPIVERLRAEFGDKDALDALHALDGTGALDAKTLADARRSKGEQSNRLRKAAIAAGVVLMAAAGAGAGAYLRNIGRIAHEVRGTKVERSSAAPTVDSPNETTSVSLSSPAPATTVATAVDVPQQAAPTVNAPNETTSESLSSPAPATTVATAVDVPQQAPRVARRPAPTKTPKPKPRTTAVRPRPQEPVATAGALSDVLGSPANIEELRPEAPVPATAP